MKKTLVELHFFICILIYSGCVSRVTAGKGKMQDSTFSGTGLCMWNESSALIKPNTFLSACQNYNFDFPYSYRKTTPHTLFPEDRMRKIKTGMMLPLFKA